MKNQQGSYSRIVGCVLARTAHVFRMANAARASTRVNHPARASTRINHPMRASTHPTLVVLFCAMTLLCVALGRAEDEPKGGVVRCANLVYAEGKSSKCFSSEFLAEAGRTSNIATSGGFEAVRMESRDLYQFPFAVMSGEDAFALTEEQRQNLRRYLENGGFLLASAGCSSPGWISSFRTEIARIFPELKLTRLEMSHPAFHTVFEIQALDCKRRGQAHLEGLEIDGRIALIFSEDGLNDTGNAGGRCCCCGGNEILNAKQVNVNLLAYALTH